MCIEILTEPCIIVRDYSQFNLTATENHHRQAKLSCILLENRSHMSKKKKV